MFFHLTEHLSCFRAYLWAFFFKLASNNEWQALTENNNSGDFIWENCVSACFFAFIFLVWFWLVWLNKRNVKICESSCDGYIACFGIMPSFKSEDCCKNDDETRFALVQETQMNRIKYTADTFIMKQKLDFKESGWTRITAGFVNQLQTPNLTQFHIQHHSRRGDTEACVLWQQAARLCLCLTCHHVP